MGGSLPLALCFVFLPIFFTLPKSITQVVAPRAVQRNAVVRQWFMMAQSRGSTTTYKTSLWLIRRFRGEGGLRSLLSIIFCLLWFTYYLRSLITHRLSFALHLLSSIFMSSSFCHPSSIFYILSSSFVLLSSLIYLRSSIFYLVSFIVYLFCIFHQPFCHLADIFDRLHSILYPLSYIS